MASEVDRTIERASETIDRVRARVARPAMIEVRRGLRRLRRFILMSIAGIFALLVGTTLWSMVISPIGLMGFLLMLFGIFAVVVLAALFSGEGEVRADSIAQASLPQIADRTDRWLDQQRRALPAPAQHLTDAIARQLHALGPQFEALDASRPEAHEIRRLVAEDLPDLVERYRRVPDHLRRENRNGRVAEQELVEGLAVVNQQIDEIGRTLAARDMDRLSSHKRYLELRYQGDDSTD